MTYKWIFVCLVALTYFNELEGKARLTVQNMTCIFLPKYYSEGNCSYRKINGSFTQVDGSVTIIRALDQVIASIYIGYIAPRSLSRKYQTILNVELDVCRYLTGKNGPLSHALSKAVPYLLQYTNGIKTCPYSPGIYYARKLPITSNFLPFDPPIGKYEVKTTFKADNETYFIGGGYGIIY